MEIIASPLGPRMLILTTSIGKMKSIFQEEIPRATEKRIREHQTGRWLLQEGLKKWGFIIYHILKSVEQKNEPILRMDCERGRGIHCLILASSL